MLGLIVPSGGSITIMGEDMLRHRHRVLPRLNFSSPYVDFPNRLKVRENLMVFAQLYGLRQARARIDELATDLDLAQLLDQKTGSLSSGQKTRVSVAKALLNRPEILLLDEPTASLDPDTADWVRGYLEKYQRAGGASILLASHNMAEVERLCDEVLMMKAGRIVDRGAPEALVARYGRQDLEEVFLDIARNRAAAAQ
jgi:ABC-2 type transport system ATP-binding protein